MARLTPAAVKSMAIVLTLGAMASAQGVYAKVAAADANGFVVRHIVEVPRTPDEVWRELMQPARWWDSQHTWSGDAANLSLDQRAGGCFCEVLPNEASAKAAPRGSVEHMRVVNIEHARVLRMRGGLGPLQSEAVNGVMTIQLKLVDATGGASGKTQVLVEYVVGGYMRVPTAKIASAVDAVVGEQFRRLAGDLGGAFDNAFPAPGEQGDQEGEGLRPLPGVEPLASEPPVGVGDEAVGR